MKRHAKLGITQLELMISLAIMALIAVFLANTLNFNRLSLERIQLTSRQTEQYLNRETLRTHIEEIPITAVEPDLFQGTAESLVFKTVVLDGSFWAGEWTTVRLSRGDDDGLSMQMSGRHPSEAIPQQSELSLASNISGFSILYYGFRQAEQKALWGETWAEGNRLPDLVKIEWDTSGRPSPPLTFVPGKVERQRYMSLSSLVPPG